jgi:biofilm PGA synthesis N-glycosyltransferase PgaC
MYLLLSIFILSFLIQVGFWGVIFRRFTRYQPLPTSNITLEPVSVVICARNEAVNLQKNLQSILEQDYPCFEVIVVNDDSSDETQAVLDGFSKEYHILVKKIQGKRTFGKKNALTLGIDLTQYNWVLLTDADCIPASNQWIRSMQRARCEDTEIVLGYGPYTQYDKILSHWVQFETLYVAVQYFSAALWKHPYMGVGRNLMYKKALFDKNQGFESHKHLISGDDDLFVNETGNRKNTVICIEPKSYMYSDSPSSWSALYRQKKRHFSSSIHYRLKFKLLLSLLSFSHALFYCSVLALLFVRQDFYLVAILVTIRTLFVQVVFSSCMTKLQAKMPFYLVFLFDLITPLYYLLFAITLPKKRHVVWK